MFKVIDVSTGEHLPGLPTPRLISEGGGLAWPKEWPDSRDPSVPFIQWRSRDVNYDPEGTVYRRVRIEHTDDSMMAEVYASIQREGTR